MNYPCQPLLDTLYQQALAFLHKSFHLKDFISWVEVSDIFIEDPDPLVGIKKAVPQNQDTAFCNSLKS
jgi:hypothetical protein